MSGRKDFEVIRAHLNAFDETRNFLDGVNTTINRIAKAVGKVGGVVTSAVTVFSKDIYCRMSLSTISGKVEMAVTLSMDSNFVSACKVIVKNLDYLINLYKDNPNILRKINFQQTLFQYNNNEIIISFYGDSNAGKSTLLNCILGDRYLPSKQTSNTAATVHIQFMDPKSDKLDVEDLWDDSANEILCSRDGKEIILAKGQKEISRTLSKINKDKRELKKNSKYVNSTFILKLKHPLGIASSEDRKFILFDNPGSDEYGSDTITSCTEMAKAISSAFIFVTTVDGYNKVGCAKMLQRLYNENPEILKQNRLTIVINKMDLALEDLCDEDSSSSKEVLSQARLYFCTTVFKCEDKDLPSDSVIFLCGQWALMSRSYKKTKGDNFKKYLQSQSVVLKAIDEFHDNEDLQHIETESPMEQAFLLEKYSNIVQLEQRLRMMAEESTLLWKHKMRQDLNGHLIELSKQLKVLIERECLEIADFLQQVNPLHNAILNVHSCYSRILSNFKLCKKRQLPKDNVQLLEFKDSYEKDMQKMDR